MDTALTRRNLFRYSVAGAAVVGLGTAVPFGRSARTATASRMPEAQLPRPFAAAFQPQRELTGRDMVHPTEGPYRLYEVTARRGSAVIVPGFNTPVWAYNGSVPGPFIKVDQGTRVKLRVRNQLFEDNPMSNHPFEISTHLHGSASLPQYDGYASDVTLPGQYKDYWYPNWQNARTLWYHDHGVHHTAQNAYGGLAAQYLLQDPTEKALLPQGQYDVPLTVSDAQFNADGSLMYDDHTFSGLWGDVVLVNGVPWPRMDVKQRVYRFRLLNASIARSYNFRFVVSRTVSGGPALGTVIPAYIVATDGGLVPRAIQVQNWRQAGSERYEFLLDLRKLPIGVQVEMRNTSNANNIDYANTNKVMRLDVTAPYDAATDPAPGTNTVPGTLYTHEVMAPLRLANGATVTASTPATTTLRVERDPTKNEWQINKRTWQHVVDSGYREIVANPKEDEVQVWAFENRSGGWFHPLHVHLVDFRILARSGGAGRVLPQEAGPKDVAYVGEGETVKVAIRFRLNPANSGSGSSDSGSGTRNRGGRYMVHCHNLPHEDHDMMVQYAVGDPADNDPIGAAPALADDGTYDDGVPA